MALLPMHDFNVFRGAPSELILTCDNSFQALLQTNKFILDIFPEGAASKCHNQGLQDLNVTAITRVNVPSY